jgi:hypothetical protein
MSVLKKLLGVFTGILAITYFIMAVNKEQTALFVILGIIMALFTILLFKPTQKDIMKNNGDELGIAAEKTKVKQELPESSTTDYQNDSYVSTENAIYRTDGSPISNDEVPYLNRIGYEQAVEYQKNSTNPKFHRTGQEDDLCIRFMMNHEHEIQTHTDNFEDCYRSAFNEKDLDKKIILLEKTISEYEKSQKWFYRTKGGAIYFQDYYEHMHNSNNNDFSYIDGVQEYLDDCIEKRDYIIPQILYILSSNGEIMQKDIYKHLPKTPKSEIQQIIRELEKNDKISREKNGNSYLLKLK